MGSSREKGTGVGEGSVRGVEPRSWERGVGEVEEIYRREEGERGEVEGRGKMERGGGEG